MGVVALMASAKTCAAAKAGKLCRQAYRYTKALGRMELGNTWQPDAHRRGLETA